MPKISVIVPAYNSEKFVAETLDSLVNQTLDDIEVLVVDDGSKDSTGEIVKQYCEKYSYIKYIYQENAGVSAARNKAIPLATGEYSVFLDSDDVYTPESLEGFYNAAKQTGADLVIGRLKSFGAGVSAYNEYAEKLSKKKEIDTYDYDLLWNFLIGNKCYNTKKLQQSGVLFPYLTYSEEGVFFTSFVYTGAKIVGTENSTMCYRRHTTEEGLSVSQSVNISLVKNFISSLTAIYDNAKKCFETIKCDDEECYLQEILYKTAHILIFQFYRHFWRADQECLDYVGQEFERLWNMMNEKTRKRLRDFNSDINIYPLCVDKNQVASKPAISVFVKDFGNVNKTLETLFESSYPYFEVFIPESVKKNVSDSILNNQNLHIVSDKNFMAAAKKNAKGKYKLTISKENFVDDRIFRFIVRFGVPDIAKKLFFGLLYKVVDKKIS